MIYFLRHVETGLIKIGYTTQYQGRFDTLRREYGALELLGLMDGNYENEQSVQQQFIAFHVVGKLRGQEWFQPAPELLKFIAANTSLNLPLPFAPDSRKRFPPPLRIAHPRRERAPKDRPGIHNALAELIKAKSVELGRKFTVKELSAATGISRQVIHYWLLDDVKSIDVRTGDAFCKFFNCNYGDLLYRVTDHGERVA